MRGAAPGLRWNRHLLDSEQRSARGAVASIPAAHAERAKGLPNRTPTVIWPAHPRRCCAAAALPGSRTRDAARHTERPVRGGAHHGEADCIRLWRRRASRWIGREPRSRRSRESREGHSKSAGNSKRLVIVKTNRKLKKKKKTTPVAVFLIGVLLDLGQCPYEDQKEFSDLNLQ